MKKNYLRLNHYISNSGIVSRRKADHLIKLGLIKVNGKIINKIGYKININDNIIYNNYLIKPKKKIYLLLNKPKGIITTTSDDKNRKTVIDILSKKITIKYRIYPVGRLDKQTTGILLLTNDGNITKILTHPKYKIKKGYNVILNKNLNKLDLKKIKNGIYLSEGITKIDKIHYINNSLNEIFIELHIGWNRVIRRIFNFLNYKIIKLDRIFLGKIKNNLKEGQWRFLTKKEIIYLNNLNK
ncbi:MAG: pseudouridine synthase [Candidatus Bostrichicola ureolyticus]|nr:MAG: pseudouridine synthase [Candidatus Bostrichicola ureolyticus]